MTDEPLSVLVTRIHPDARIPEYHSGAAAAFDLAAVADVTVPPGQVGLIPTGLVIRVPLRMFLGIFARSSTPLKRGLMVANGVGVIDQDYCGGTDEVKIQVLNFTAEAVRVGKGDRIAQGLFIPVARAEWRESDGDLREGSCGGFGATGR